MRRLIDLDHKKEIGFIDWEFIHDMQGVVPELITPEIITLSKKFLDNIPPKWDEIKKKLAAHAVPKETVHVAIADIENMGNEFKVRGILHDKEGRILDFHRVVLYDEDRFEDDYLGAVFTDEDGEFTLSFGKKAFSDFGLESEPDIYVKIFYWSNHQFHAMGKTTPQVYEKVETIEGKTLFDLGVVTI